MEQKTYIKIPINRLGVLIGSKGKVKRRIESTYKVELTIGSDTGNIEITLTTEQSDVSVLFTIKNIIKAIGRGFSPERAMTLMNEDNVLFVMDLEDYVGTSRNSQERIKGRIIGKGGKSRAILEELTNTNISVYGGTVSIIGLYEDIQAAKEAILMLIDGAFHKTVWNYLYAYRRKIKEERREIWYDIPSEEKLE